jgi:hypothetical protein
MWFGPDALTMGRPVDGPGTSPIAEPAAPRPGDPTGSELTIPAVTRANESRPVLGDRTVARQVDRLPVALEQARRPLSSGRRRHLSR